MKRRWREREGLWACRDVHDDLAGALHDVGVVEGLALLAARARLGEPVMFAALGSRAPLAAPARLGSPRSPVSRSSTGKRGTITKLM